jgi:GcrA cell cycle regulator
MLDLSRHETENGGTGMWTQQAVETLRKLAVEGRSAAWIAAALGAPSRDAVIGKASRIGIRLNGGTGSALIGEGQRSERPTPVIPWGGGRIRRPQGKGPRSEQPAETPSGMAVSRARSRAPAIPRENKRADRWIFATAEVGEMRRIGFTEIGEVECRWPLGDPTQEDFAYCGLQVAKHHAYCAGHCRLAYRSPNTQAAKGD